MLLLNWSLEVCLSLLAKDVSPCSVPEARDVVVVRPDMGFYHSFPVAGDGVGFVAVPFAARSVSE